MVAFVVSLLIAEAQGHRLLRTSAPQSAASALQEFNTLAGTHFNAQWFEQASTGHQLPFVYAAGPVGLLLVTVHHV